MITKARASTFLTLNAKAILSGETLLTTFGRDTALSMAGHQKRLAYERIMCLENHGWTYGLEIDFWADVECVIMGEDTDNLQGSILEE
jgi:hypothetical protein